MTASPYEGPTGLRWAFRAYRRRRKALQPIESTGFALGFLWDVLSSIPFTLRRYRAQTARMITSMTWGNGAVIVGGGTVPLMAMLGLAMGIGVAIQTYAVLSSLGMAPMVGVISSFANTRELAPIVAGIGFAAQAGCGLPLKSDPSASPRRSTRSSRWACGRCRSWSPRVWWLVSSQSCRPS